MNISPSRSFGSSLLDKSTAHPGNIDMSVFAPKRPAAKEGATSSDYLQKTREDNPDPETKQQAESVALSNCKITTPADQLATDQPYEMSVEAKASNGPASGTVTFSLICTIPRPDGSEEIQDQSVALQAILSKGIATASGKLFSPRTPVPAGSMLRYHVVAQHPQANAKVDSPKVEVEAEKPPQPLAVWSLGPAHFGHGSSFVLPSSCTEWSKLQALLDQHPKAATALFGHSRVMGDPVADKALSGRRSRAVHALLTRDVDGWLKLAQGTQFDPWDLDTTQTALSTLKNAAGTPYYGGALDGLMGPKTRAAIETFQKDNELRADGVAGPKTKAKLYPAYMDEICLVRLKPEVFVGDPKDSKQQWASGGCGDANPALVLAKTNEDKSDHPLRTSPNQRTTVVLFPEPCKGAGNITFPCPAWSDGTTKCRAEAHQDASIRQNPSDTERICETDKNTFGCKFYSRIAELEKIAKAALPPKKPTITTLHLGVFNDGTGNHLDWDMKTDSVSNIGKLYQLYPQTMEAAELWDKHYVHGIGTDGSFDGLKQGFAVGFEERVTESLRWLHDMIALHPDAELKLHIFGFSRGAAEARALVNELFDDAQRAQYGLSKTKIEIEVLALFDTVGSIGLPGNGIDLGYDLTVHADRVTKVIHLIAQFEVRSNFDLWSIRCPPGLHTDSRLEEWVKTGGVSVAPEDWEEYRGRSPMPNPNWEEWILPGVHSDVGGGYSPEEWIPDLPSPTPHAEEPLNEYVYRILDDRMEQGATPRGLVCNTAESKDELKPRVKHHHEERYRRAMAEFERVRQEAHATGQPGAIPERLRSKPVLRIPEIRQLNNDLSRLALEVMRHRTTVAGVRWGEVSKTPSYVQKWFEPLPPGHLLSRFLEHSNDMNVFESTLQVGLDSFQKLVAEYIHDSRWFLDLSRRKRDVYFGGRRK